VCSLYHLMAAPLTLSWGDTVALWALSITCTSCLLMLALPVCVFCRSSPALLCLSCNMLETLYISHIFLLGCMSHVF